MKSDCSAPSWLKFFMSAGIQKDSAETYAVTFSKNQIQLDMLPEIKKEYLVDMGITLMGHIIAILRHAKTVHTEEVTKSTLSTNKGGSNAASKAPAPTNKPVSKTTPMVVKDKVQTPSAVVKVASTSQEDRVATKSVVAPQARPSTDSVEKRRDKPPVDKVPVVQAVYGPALPRSLLESPVKRKLASEEASSPDESDSKKRIFQRLGQVPNSHVSAESSPSNGESVFSRLGQKTAVVTLAEPPMVVAPKKITVKPIIATPKQTVKLIHSPALIMSDPKKKVMMLNKGVLTKTMRADQDVPSKILSSTSLAAEHTSQTIQNARLCKNNVYSRLGTAAMDLNTIKSTTASSKVKRVSFGNVFEKTIPPVQKAQFCSFSGSSFSSNTSGYKRKPSIGANGVFSRLGI